MPIKENLFNKRGDIKEYIQSDNFICSLNSLTAYLTASKEENIRRYNPEYEDIESIKYDIRNKENTLHISNIDEALMENQIKESQFYLHVITDENGNPQIESSLGKKFNKDAFINTLYMDEEKIEYANLEIIYIIPKNINSYHDVFTYDMKSVYMMDYVILILVIGGISALVLSIIALCIPYSTQSKMPIVDLFNKMRLELKVFIWITFIVICGIGISFIGDNYNIYNEVFNIVDVLYDGNLYFYLIGIPITFTLYFLLYLSIIYIKFIYYTGWKEGLVRNSILGKICLTIIAHFRKLSQEIVGDITNKYHKKLLIILGVNLIVLWIIALGKDIGSIIAFLYTVFLFKYLSGFMMDMKVLNDATSQFAKGDFHLSLKEDMGIFSSLSKNLNQIKDGFKVAIDKEVKSQKMKTELISNVSHDLKTPLTSIITYVDLLKNEDNTIKVQKEYIEILDRKSKRLKVLIEDLFEASKVGSGNIELQLEPLDVIALFRQTLGELEEKINQSTLQIKVSAPENKILCELDGRRTYRVFENIMSNILKYSMANSRVYIDIIEGEKDVIFTFKNISAYEMNFSVSEITARFTRGDKSRNTDGSGLGLAIAKSLIDLQKGALEIKVDGDLFKLSVIFPKI